MVVMVVEVSPGVMVVMKTSSVMMVAPSAVVMTPSNMTSAVRHIIVRNFA